MGGQISKMMGKIFGSKEMRLLMLGLDAAGKTSKSIAHSICFRMYLHWPDGSFELWHTTYCLALWTGQVIIY